ncbi:MAG: HTH domain-containing protein [Planctomycetes bacterium]|nr:HTH domain-containing protein [Planctomycetota bacterium]
MKKTVEDVQNDFIDTSGEMAERYGLTRVGGLLKGLLLLSRQPLSLDDMAERLEVSKASVSTNIRLLERWKAVRRVFNRGDRKNYYELRGDLWDIETEIVSTVLKDEIEKFGDCLSQWKSELAEAEEGDPEEREFLTKRLEEIDEYFDAVRHVLELLTREGKVTPAAIKKIQIL